MYLEIKECIFTPLRIAAAFPAYCTLLINYTYFTLIRHKLPLQYYANPANIDRKSANTEKRGQYGIKSANTESDVIILVLLHIEAHGNKRSEFFNGNSCQCILESIHD